MGIYADVAKHLLRKDEAVSTKCTIDYEIVPRVECTECKCHRHWLDPVGDALADFHLYRECFENDAVYLQINQGEPLRIPIAVFRRIVAAAPKVETQLAERWDPSENQ